MNYCNLTCETCMVIGYKHFYMFDMKSVLYLGLLFFGTWEIY